MLNILITGGAGSIGSALALGLIKSVDCRLVIIDNLLTGKMDNLDFLREGLDCLIVADVNVQDTYLHSDLDRQFDIIFHYAAVVGVSRTLRDPFSVFRDVDGLRLIFEFARVRNVKRVFFSSSSEVYGESLSFPQYVEGTPLNSRLPYSVVKNLGEAYCRAYHELHDINYTVFRFFNTYGPRQSEDFVLPRFLRLALRNEDILIYGDGLQTRTFCYIDDNIDFTLRCVMNGTGILETINVGHDIEIRIIDLARIIISVTGSRSQIVFRPALPEGDMMRRCPDVSRMREILCRDLISLSRGLQSLIDFYGSRG